MTETPENPPENPKPRWRRHGMTVAIVIFAALFVLGQARGVWLPFWVVATVGSALFALYLVAAALAEAFAGRRPLKAWAETVLLTAVAGYSFWISIGHLTEELSHL